LFAHFVEFVSQLIHKHVYEQTYKALRWSCVRSTSWSPLLEWHFVQATTFYMVSGVWKGAKYWDSRTHSSLENHITHEGALLLCYAGCLTRDSNIIVHCLITYSTNEINVVIEVTVILVM